MSNLLKSLVEIIGVKTLTTFITMEFMQELIISVLIVIINCLLIPLFKKLVNKLKHKSKNPVIKEEMNNTLDELEKEILEKIKQAEEELKQLKRGDK